MTRLVLISLSALFAVALAPQAFAEGGGMGAREPPAMRGEMHPGGPSAHQMRGHHHWHHRTHHKMQ
jgi:hypothetical protein